MEDENEKPPEPAPTPAPLATPPPAPAATDQPSLLDKANATAERLEKANKDFAALLDKQERLRVQDTLGGTAHAGAQTETLEEKQIASAKQMLQGTGFEDMFDPPPAK